MSNLFNVVDSFFDDIRPLTAYRLPVSAQPSLNVKEFKNRYEISLAIAGIDPKEVKIELVNRVLTVSYEHKEEKKEQDDGVLLREEYRHYSFTRSVTLPKNIDENSVKATSKKSILTLSVTKTPDAEPKRISVTEED